MTFKELHQQKESLLICNVWDVASAKLAEKLGFQAIGTSSAAIATIHGLEDGENLSFQALLRVVESITANISIPLTVDIEAGYSREPQQITDNIRALVDAGAVAINIEDSIVNKERSLVEPIKFSEILSQIKKQLADQRIDVFINVRTDTFLLGVTEAVSETQERIKLYEQAGADGIFVPCIEKEQDIRDVVLSTDLPINVMCMPNLPVFKKLNELGVKRISMGNFLFDDMLAHFEQSLNSILKQNTFEPIFKC